MHSKVDTESRPTASPKRSDSSSIASRVAWSPRSTRASSSRSADSAATAAAASDSRVTDTSSSFCSCICREQSRPPIARVHSPLPMTCISWCRVVSMFSSTSTFLLSPSPVAFTSLSISRTISAVRAASPTSRMRWPLPPPPPMALRRMRFLGCSAAMRSTASVRVSQSSSTV